MPGVVDEKCPIAAKTVLLPWDIMRCTWFEFGDVGKPHHPARPIGGSFRDKQCRQFAGECREIQDICPFFHQVPLANGETRWPRVPPGKRQPALPLSVCKLMH